MKGTLVDANLLCLLTVGQLGPTAVSAHPRLHVFDYDDFEMLELVISRLGDPILCPHILAETANLIAYRQTVGSAARMRAALASLIESFHERSVPASETITDAAYLRLGLTDAVLLLLGSTTNITLVSDDLQLCLEAERRSLRVLNYNYLRDGAIKVEQLR